MLSSLQHGDSVVCVCVCVCLCYTRVHIYIVPSARRGLARGVHGMASAPRWGRIVCGMDFVAEDMFKCMSLYRSVFLVCSCSC